MHPLSVWRLPNSQRSCAREFNRLREAARTRTYARNALAQDGKDVCTQAMRGVAVNRAGMLATNLSERQSSVAESQRFEVIGGR